MSNNNNNSGSKYRRVIHDLDDPSKMVTVDVYSVTDCFEVTSGPIHHAVKKLLCAGLRGAKSRIQDLRESLDAVQRAIQLELVKEAMRVQPDEPDEPDVAQSTGQLRQVGGGYALTENAIRAMREHYKD